jgi:predicted kinase
LIENSNDAVAGPVEVEFESRWVAYPSLSLHKGKQQLDGTTMTIPRTEENDVARMAVESSSSSSLVERAEESTAERRRSWRVSTLRRLGSVRRFSSLLSTEQLHCADNLLFHGPYSHLRRVLDYSYYRNYSKERQWLQDAIIEDMLDNVDDPDMCITPTEPWFIFTVGARGAGKNHVIRSLVKSGRLPILSFVHVDPDSIRRRLPEFESYAKLNPTHVNDFTRKECGYIAELLLMAGLQHGRNVVFDSAMRNTEWFSSFIGTLKKGCAKEMFGLLTNIKIAVLHITAPTDVILERVQKKSLETGREIDEESVLKSLEAIPASLDVVRDLVDFYCEIFNGVDDYTLVGGGIDWDDFRQTFLQTCAWKPGMKGAQQIRYLSIQDTEDANLCAIRRARETRKPFSVLISSEENNKSDDMNFYGKYSYIRKTLDYEYHSNYTFERQKLQDAIISDMLDEAFIFDENGNVGTVPKEPWIVFTAGAMGAGKSHTMGVLVKKGRFPLTAFVRVDPDEVRRILPEYHVYIIENPELAGELTKKEVRTNKIVRGKKFRTSMDVLLN